MAPPSHCAFRTRCGGLAGQQQNVPRAIQSLHWPQIFQECCFLLFSGVSLHLGGSTPLICTQGQVLPYGWPASGCSLGNAEPMYIVLTNSPSCEMSLLAVLGFRLSRWLHLVTVHAGPGVGGLVEK